MGQQGLSVKYWFMKHIILAIRKFFTKKEKEKITAREYFRRLMEEGPQYPNNFEFVD